MYSVIDFEREKNYDVFRPVMNSLVKVNISWQ